MIVSVCAFIWILNSLVYQVVAKQADQDLDGFRPQAQIRCIGNIPVSPIWKRKLGVEQEYDPDEDEQPTLYNTVREICAKPIYGGSGEQWTAGGYCAFNARPKTVVFEQPNLGRDLIWERSQLVLFCQTRCRCVTHPLEQLYEEGRPAEEIAAAEREVRPPSQIPRTRGLDPLIMDFNPKRALIGRAAVPRTTTAYGPVRVGSPEYVYFMREADSVSFDSLVQDVNMSVVDVVQDGLRMVCDGEPGTANNIFGLERLLPAHLQRALYEEAARSPVLSSDYDQNLRRSPTALYAAPWLGGSYSANAGYHCVPNPYPVRGLDIIIMVGSPTSYHPTLVYPDGERYIEERMAYFCKAFCRCLYDDHSRIDLGRRLEDQGRWVRIFAESGEFPSSRQSWDDVYNTFHVSPEHGLRNYRTQARLEGISLYSTCPIQAPCTNWAGCAGVRMQPGCEKAVCAVYGRQRSNWRGRCTSLLSSTVGQSRLGGRSLSGELMEEIGDGNVAPSTRARRFDHDHECLCNSTYVDGACCTAQDGLVWKAAG